MSGVDWRQTVVAPDGTHHLIDGIALYEARFIEVLKFHAPGLAPVHDAAGAFHVTVDGRAAYERRYQRAFGFYDGLAAVDAGAAGWHHIRPDGEPAYDARWRWCGNFQGGRCPVRDVGGGYFHIDPTGEPLYAARWRYAGDYRDGVAVVQNTDGRSSHIDQVGAVTHGRWFLDLDVFHKGFARARDEFGWTHINVIGEPAYTRRFASVEPYYNGQARVERFDGGLEVIDERGHLLIELRTTPHSEPIEGVVLARTAWGRVQLVELPGARPFVSKWTRGSNDREVETLLALRGQPGVPELLGRERFDMNDRLLLSMCPGEVVGEPRRLRRFPKSEAVRITREVLTVCAAMHDAGWIHTDVHPGNVLTGEPVTLLDFACAVRATYTTPWRGEINWGVWEYVPPEQLADFGELGPSTDVYSAAALCVAMLRGGPPYRVAVQRHVAAGGWPEVRAAFLRARTTQGLDDIRPDLARVLARGLAVDPAVRPTARELAEELKHV